MSTLQYFLLAALAVLFTARPGIAASDNQHNPVDLKSRTLVNKTAYIPAQCYVKTKVSASDDRSISNPCYVCHTRSQEPCYTNDQALQLSWSMPEAALQNPWTNLFEDRSERVKAISDTAIEEYIRHSNYFDTRNRIILQQKLTALPESWDINGNRKWDGYSPDCWFSFDKQGFDKSPEGDYSGWRAFAYFPFPDTYWPGNGSIDDILIRLPDSFRTDEQGKFSLEVSRINFAIVEALIKKEDIPIPAVHEKKYGTDLNGNGRIDKASRVAFSWDPLHGKNMSYIGRAKLDQQRGVLHLAAGLFPEGTEFLQSIRYVDTKNGVSVLSRRMKELRYMKKIAWKSYAQLEEAAIHEIKEKDDFPDRTRTILGNSEQGIHNGSGWILQGFIEDEKGDLRPQSFEETAVCIGCHGGTGSSTDSTFGFARKQKDQSGKTSWYHWNEKGYTDITEPKVEIRGAGVYYEYSYFLMYNRAVNTFRNSDWIQEKFFTPAGHVKPQSVAQLHDDIAILLTPSRERALLMNKAYKTIVTDQDFINGREVNIRPLSSVQKQLKQDQRTGILQPTSINRFAADFGTSMAAAETGRPTRPRQSSPAITGKGMPGPDGTKYEVDWDGIIHKSRYSHMVPGLSFTFPPRLTLPTRYIVPTGKNRTCYTCHRLEYPTGDTPTGIHSVEPLLSTESPTRNALSLSTSKSRDINGTWSPDGKQILFVSDRSGSDQLWLMDSTGKNLRQLTDDPGIAAWPAWNASGDTIVYWTYEKSSKRYSIKTVQRKTTNGNVYAAPQELITGRAILARPVFHPQENIISYAVKAGNNWDIWIYNLDTDTKIRLTDSPNMETNPIWRPDGKAMAFKVAPGGDYPLTEEYFMTFENGYDTPTVYVWDGPQSVQMNDWSPDGKKITYTAEIISNSPGKDRVLYAAMVSDISLKNGKASVDNTRILARKQTRGDRGPVFSPDGGKIAFWGWTTGGHANIRLYSLTTEKLTDLTRSGTDMYPQWNPDGQSILFSSTRKGNRDIMLLAVPH